MIKKIANVRNVSIIKDDHGFLSFSINVEYEGGNIQDVGLLILDEYDKSLEKRVGTSQGAELIKSLFDFFGKTRLEEIKNETIRVIFEDDSYNSKVLGIENLEFLYNEKRLKRIIYKDIFKRRPLKEIDELADHYISLIRNNPSDEFVIPRCDEGNEMSLHHIAWMIEKILEANKVESVRDEKYMSDTKIHRWLGYIQGILISKGLTDVTTERKITRPILNGK